MEFLISVFIGALVILLMDMFEYIMLGDRGKRQYISNHYKALRGITEKTKRTPRRFSLKKLGVIWRKPVINRKKDCYIYALPACALLFLAALVVFGSAFMAVIISFFGLMVPGMVYSRAAEGRKETISYQMKDVLSSVSSSLKAGLSLSSALLKCVDDMEKICSPKSDQIILGELRKIKLDLNTGMPVEDALKSFKARMNMEDTDDFVDSVAVVRQRGGNLVEVMDTLTKMISDKVAIKNEVKIYTAGKKMESRILTATPVFLIVAVTLLSKEYMKPMIDSALGRILIMAGFTLLALNYLIGRKITDIKI